MSIQILATKLYIPPPRPKVVLRPRLVGRLNEGLQRKLTLISAPAGFGKTTLVSEWVSGCGLPAAWLSLDDADNDPTGFLAYFVAGLQTIAANIGKGVLGILQSPQPPPIDSILTALLNEIATIKDNFVFVLDDYHVIDAQSADHALTFLLEHMPPQMHLVIATREDPHLPLARLRARGQLTELRATDLRFTSSEAAEFLNQRMALNLDVTDIVALETRTEGWIAGLQLAAISMQGHQDATSFIKSFTGSHRFVLDYLLEEVLQQQSERVQTFLLRTSILERLCGALCDAILLDSSAGGQETLEYIEQANLFIVPLDNERRWYRYHHLFADLLRQRLHQNVASSTSDSTPLRGAGWAVADLHIRASVWYEENGLEIEAFHHAVAANDLERIERLIEGEGMPLLFRGAVAPILNWLTSQPATILNARPSLWVMYASALLGAGQLTDVEEKLQAAEAALQGVERDRKIRDVVGHIAAIRATLAVSQHQIEAIIAQSRRALTYLHRDNLPVRTATTWTLGYAYQLQGDRAAAREAYIEAISISQKIGHIIIMIAATIGLGNIQEAENELHLALQSYQRVIELVSDPAPPIVCEAYLGLARIFYQWNDLHTALKHGQQSLELARQLENTDRFVACEVFLARLKLAQRDVVGAQAILAKASHSAQQHRFVYQMSQVAMAQVMTLLQQGHLAAAAHLAQRHDLPISQARVHLAQGDASAALAVLASWHREVDLKASADQRLKVMILQAMAYYAHREEENATQQLAEALRLAEPGGFIRIFVDEGLPMAHLLAHLLPQAATHRMTPDYVGKLLAAFESEFESETLEQKRQDKPTLPPAPPAQPLIEPLSQRELEVLQLVAQGLSNREISERLFLALSTVKGHNRRIYRKLQVKRRTEAVLRARELGLL